MKIYNFLVGVIIGIIFLLLQTSTVSAFNFPSFRFIFPTFPPIPTLRPLPSRPCFPKRNCPIPSNTPTPTATITPTPHSFTDNFNDGNTDGWWLGNSQHTPWIDSNWRVENGMLVQDQGADNVIALVDNKQISSQTVSTDIKINGPSGGSGVIFWYKDNINWTYVILYPAAEGIFVSDIADGKVLSDFKYPYISANNTWYNLKVKVNSVNGNLDIYINDTYLFTYTLTVLDRTGQSGITTGNAGGYFDNFTLTWN